MGKTHLDRPLAPDRVDRMVVVRRPSAADDTRALRPIPRSAARLRPGGRHQPTRGSTHGPIGAAVGQRRLAQAARETKEHRVGSTIATTLSAESASAMIGPLEQV
jgi:hypothetical protein